MKAALATLAAKSGRVSVADRRRLMDQGARRSLRAAIFDIEKLGIERGDFARVKACLEAMIADLND